MKNTLTIFLKKSEFWIFIDFLSTFDTIRCIILGRISRGISEAKSAELVEKTHGVISETIHARCSSRISGERNPRTIFQKNQCYFLGISEETTEEIYEKFSQGIHT